MLKAQQLQEKWEPVLNHSEMEPIKDSYKRAIILYTSELFGFSFFACLACVNAFSYSPAFSAADALMRGSELVAFKNPKKIKVLQISFIFNPHEKAEILQVKYLFD